MDLKYPKPIVKLTKFTKWLNNWLMSCIAATPRTSRDIIVEHTDKGSFLYLSSDLKNKKILSYPTSNIDGDISPSDYAAAVEARVAAHGSDCNYYQHAQGYKKGTIVRVLKTQETYGDAISKYPDVNWSASSDISSSIIDGKLPLRAGTYICVADVPYSSSLYSLALSINDVSNVRDPKVCYHPLNPEPRYNADYRGRNIHGSGSIFELYQGRYWESISQPTTGSARPSGSYDECFSLVAVTSDTTIPNGNVLKCKKIIGGEAGSISGDITYVARPFKLRPHAGRRVDTVYWSYSYDATYTFRVASAALAPSENQIIIPYYVPPYVAAEGKPAGDGDIIYARRMENPVMSINTGTDTGSGAIWTDVYYVDTNNDARAWAQVDE